MIKRIKQRHLMRWPLTIVFTTIAISGCSDTSQKTYLQESIVGDVGTLASGRDSQGIAILEGLTVPTMNGAQPLKRKPLPPLPMEDHPYLLDEYASAGVHGDSYNSSVSPLPGPLGIKPSAHYTPVMQRGDLGMCTPLLRDLDDRMASVCIAMGEPSQLVLFDPENDFKPLAQVDIPKRRALDDPSGGWYTRMDNLGRSIVATPDQDVRVYEVVENNGKIDWKMTESWNLEKYLPKGVSALDVVPDWQGNYWFMTGYGHVGYINRKTGKIDLMQLSGKGELFGTALAVTRDAAYMLGSNALYRLEVDSDSHILNRWRFQYKKPTNGGELTDMTTFDSSEADLTAPTVFDNGRLISFGTNEGLTNGEGGAQGEVLVLKTSVEDLAQADRIVCEHPIFKAGKSFLGNTMIGYDRSLVVQNNYGAAFFELDESEPGLARVDVRDDYSGCDTVWEDYSVSSQVPPRLSTGDGHVYQYSRRKGTGDNVYVWYLSANDFDTGELASELFVGSGQVLDNPMLSVDFMPNGVMVSGVRNGIVTLRDNP